MSGPSIREGAQLGVNVTVLPYVVIGEGCLVGAGSVVTRDLPAGSVAFGNPATVSGRVEDLADISTRVRAHENGRRV
jgi:acetyltransferase-like isoleucine patch superfamily enzyme